MLQIREALKKTLWSDPRIFFGRLPQACQQFLLALKQALNQHKQNNFIPGKLDILRFKSDSLPTAGGI